MDIGIIILIIQLLIIGVAFFNLGLSITLYYSITILVPYIEFSILGIRIPYSTMILFYYVLFYIKNKKNKIDLFIIKPYLFLFITHLFLTFVQWETPWLYQIKQLINAFYKASLLPIVIWNISKNDPKIINYMKWSLIITLIIAGVYGLFLTQLYGLNPYTSFMASYYGIERDVADIYSTSSSRIGFSTAGKIQATMIHPMLWALILSSTFIIFSSKIGKISYWPFIILIAINIIVSGARTGIASLIIAFTYFFLLRRSIKVGVYAALAIAIVYISAELIPGLSDLFASMTDTSGTKSEVGGSSITMRIEQFEGVLKEIQGIKILIGNGYDWHGYYMQLNGDHPILLAFESSIFMILCNSGIIGAAVWIIFFLLLYRLPYKVLQDKEDIIGINTLLIMYIAYTIGTGDYWYLQFFSYLHTFLLSTKYHKFIKTK